MKNMNLQDVFLNQARKDRVNLTIYLTNGFQFKGIVKGFDNYTIILDCDGKQNIVYKHAVSTIIPVRPISILNNSGEDGENRGFGSFGFRRRFCRCFFWSTWPSRFSAVPGTTTPPRPSTPRA